MTLVLNSTKVPDDNSSAQGLLDQINYNPPTGSQIVMDAEAAYKDYFGGLSLRQNGKEVYRIEPTILKSDVSPIQYGPFSNAISLYLSGKFMSTNKASVPGIVGLGGNISNEKLYKLVYNVNQIGTVIWTPPGGKSIVTLFKELNSDEKNSLIKRFLADPSLKMYQYDHIYILKQLDLQIDSYTKANTVIDVSVPVFLSSNTSFTKDNENSYHTSVVSTTLNIWAEKDVTILLVDAAKDYLAEQQRLVEAATTSKDAQAVVKNAFKVDNVNVLPTAATDTKQSINIKITDLKNSISSQTDVK